MGQDRVPSLRGKVIRTGMWAPHGKVPGLVSFDVL